MCILDHGCGGDFMSYGLLVKSTLYCQSRLMHVSCRNNFSLFPQCDRTASLDAFFASVVYDEDSTRDKIAILGCGCSVATEPVAEISHRWNISQVSNAILIK